MGVFWRGRLEEWAGGSIRPNRDAPQGPTATITIQQPDQQVNTCNDMQSQTAVTAHFIYMRLLLLYCCIISHAAVHQHGQEREQ